MKQNQSPAITISKLCLRYQQHQLFADLDFQWLNVLDNVLIGAHLRGEKTTTESRLKSD